MNLMFIGNPGSVKSTTCNAILGQVAFNSGLHTTGLTTESSQHPWEHEGVMHAITDTPGLADVNMRKEAAEEISKALKGDIIYKIFFVVTLESGRVRPADLITIDLVLDCLPDKGANIPVRSCQCHCDGDVQKAEKQVGPRDRPASIRNCLCYAAA